MVRTLSSYPLREAGAGKRSQRECPPEAAQLKHENAMEWEDNGWFPVRKYKGRFSGVSLSCFSRGQVHKTCFQEAALSSSVFLRVRQLNGI